MERFFPIFGVPIYQDVIPGDFYNKQEIITSIIHNYSKNSTRNNWGLKNGNLHHAYNDWANKDLIKVDFSQLEPHYSAVIEKFFRRFDFKEKFNYEWNIVNYTCTGRGQYMSTHVHDSTFTAVHYIKFDEDVHSSTRLHNPAPWARYFETLKPVTFKKLNKNNSLNSWGFDDFLLKVKEDEIIIHPGVLEHSLPSSESDELRITIVFNIEITQ